jgi:hypothetical protein
MQIKGSLIVRLGAALAYLVMLAVNFLAVSLPLNGVTQADIADSYPNLFAPAGFAFSIWGIIYLLLAGYTIFQLGLGQIEQSRLQADFFNKVGVLFALSSLVNAAWLFSWHYNAIVLSLILMLGLLICLILIVQDIKKKELLFREKVLVRLPFSIYFGWITVATIANATVLLVYLGWDGFGISEVTWTVLMLIAGLLIGGAAMFRNKDLAYGLVIIWAYTGILYKHISAGGFDGHYPAVIYTVVACLVLLLIAEAFVLFSGRKKKPV